MYFIYTIYTCQHQETSNSRNIDFKSVNIHKKLQKSAKRVKYKIDDGNSVAYINDFILDNTDKIRVWCVNWSEATEVKRNFTDNLAVALNPRYFLNWINNEAGG